MASDKPTQAQRRSDTSQHSLDERIGTIENLLTQLIQGKKSDFKGIFLPTDDDTSSSSDKERLNDKRAENTRKRSLSIDRDREVKRRRSQDEEFKCTFCYKKYQNKSYLFRHYRVKHRESSPERVHENNLKNKKIPIKKADKIVKRTSNVTTTPKESKGISYDCKLCEAIFTSTSARNSHYTGKHQINDEKLLFFPDGSALVESSLQHQISLKPEWFKAVSKRNMSSRVCKLCEVELDKDDLIKWHYEKTHKVFQMSKVKPLIRLNNTDTKQIAADHKCNHCSDAFTDPTTLEKHVLIAHPNDVMKCKICNKSVEKKVYNNHVKEEHADVFFKKVDVVTGKKVTQTRVDKLCKRVEVQLQRTIETKDAKIAKVTEKKQEAKPIRARRASFMPESSRAVPLMYLCGACNLVTSSYDNVVAHSQDHILNKVTTESELCEICDLNFDVDFATHKQMHLSNNDLDRDSFRFISYDYRDLMSDKWFHMFETFAKSKINRITSASIYFSTRCVRLKLQGDRKDASAQFTLFQCVTCKRFVDPYSIKAHVELQNACTNQLSSYPCYICLKTFFTQKARDDHNLTHKVSNADLKYRTVLFNDQNDLTINKTLLVYAGKGQKENSNDQNVERIPVHKVPNVVTSESKEVTPERVRNDANKVSTERERTRNLTGNKEKVAHVYKCQCGLCFDRLKFLFKHLKNCTPSSKSVTVNCKCGLVFDRLNYTYHSKVHRDDFTTFDVKEVILRDARKIDVTGMAEDFKKNYERKRRLSKETDKLKDQTNHDDDDKNAKPMQHEKATEVISSPNEQVHTKEVLSENNVLVHTEEVIKDIEMSAILEKEQKSLNDVIMTDVSADNKESNDTQLIDKNVNSIVQNFEQDEVDIVADDKNNETEVTKSVVVGEHLVKVTDITNETEVTKSVVVGEHLVKVTDSTNETEVTKNVVVGEHLVKVTDTHNHNLNSIQRSENTEENKSMVEATIGVEIKETENESKLSNQNQAAQQTKMINNVIDEIEKSRQIASSILDTNEIIKDNQELKNDDNKAISIVPLQNNEAIYNQDTKQNSVNLESEVVDPIKSNTIDDQSASGSVLTKSNPESKQVTASNNVIQETIGIPSEQCNSQNSDITNTEDYDEEELLKGPEDEVEDLLITDDEDPIDSGVDLTKVKKKIETLFSSFSSKKVKQELIDFVTNRDSKLNQ